MESDEVLLECLPPESGRAIDEIIGESAPVTDLKQTLIRFANADVTVLIRGETGTGKDMCARAIHKLSGRGSGPFVVENCGRIPVDLIANEFFGHEAGAFTGATQSTGGLIGRARGGTLVLDEIDSLPIVAQAIFLRFLQDHCVQKLGGNQVHKVDVRIIAITNANLEERMQRGEFRKDLYHRLRVAELEVPPLRNRRSDIEVLSRHFLKEYAIQFCRPVPLLTADCLSALESYDWPGNVRELEDTIQRAMIVLSGTCLNPSDFRLPLPATTSVELDTMPFNTAKSILITNFEVRYLKNAMQAAGGNIAKAARAAGLQKATMWNLLRKHQLLLAPLAFIGC